MTNTPSMALDRVTIIGAGRLGRALASALADRGITVRGPLPRGEWEDRLSENEIVVLCVPDGEIARVARSINVNAIVGHCSGSMTLEPLSPHRGFSLHPLLAITGDGTRFDGAAAAIAGTNEKTLDVARQLALALRMEPITVFGDRTLYHAAAVLASNYLVAVEETAATLGSAVGLERRHLAKLAESALSNWARDGAASLTGPIVRGDEAVIARQRDAIAITFPKLVSFWDALTERTRSIAAELKR